MTTTYRIDFARLTVIATDEHGEDFDLNGQGEPCRTREDLEQFIAELRSQGAYGDATYNALLDSLPAVDEDEA